MTIREMPALYILEGVICLIIVAFALFYVLPAYLDSNVELTEYDTAAYWKGYQEGYTAYSSNSTVDYKNKLFDYEPYRSGYYWGWEEAGGEPINWFYVWICDGDKECIECFQEEAEKELRARQSGGMKV